MLNDTITKVQAYADSECFLLFIRLFKELIESNREKNDTALSEEVTLNQGAIRQLKELLKMQTVRPSKYAKQDGAFF